MTRRTHTRLVLLALVAWLCAGFAADTLAQMLDSGQDRPVYTLVDGQDSASEPCVVAPDPLGDGIEQTFVPSVQPASCIGRALPVITATVQPPSPGRFSWQGRAPPHA